MKKLLLILAVMSFMACKTEVSTEVEETTNDSTSQEIGEVVIEEKTEFVIDSVMTSDVTSVSVTE